MVAASFDQVEPGLRARTERVIDESLLTRHVGGSGLFATPSMILLMEQAAHHAVEAQLPAGHTTVGYEVCVQHLKPAQAGDTIVVTALLEEITGRRLHFAVECTTADGGTLIGSGTHRRAIVPTPD